MHVADREVGIGGEGVLRVGGYKQSGLSEENSRAELLSYTRAMNVNLSALPPRADQET